MNETKCFMVLGDEMRKFSIPYNNDIELLNRLADNFGKLDECGEIYFAIPQKYVSTGRTLEQSEQYELEVEILLEKCNKYKVESNILLNAGCLQTKMRDYLFAEKCVEYLKKLHNEYDLTSVTVADYLLAKYIKENAPTLKVECSSVAYVDSLQKAKMWAEIGTDILVIPPDYNKSIKFISSIKEAYKDMEIKLLVNQDCIPGCPMRQFHNTIQSHGNDGPIYLKTCGNYMKEHPWLFYSSTYIPPKYLSYYDEYVDIYKIVDRKKPTEKIIKAYGSYSGHDKFKEKAEEWNRRIPEYVFEKVILCEKKCNQCGFCKREYEKNKVTLQNYINGL